VRLPVTLHEWREVLGDSIGAPTIVWGYSETNEPLTHSIGEIQPPNYEPRKLEKR
jgi:hypothetical protein